MNNTSNSPENVQSAAANVKTTIRQTGKNGSASLLDFAEKYAVSTALRDNAVVLNLECKSDTAANEDDLIVRMISLIDQIIVEHVSTGGEEAIVERQRVVARMREHFQRLAPSQDIVFEGTSLSKSYSSGFQLGSLDLSLRLGEITGVVGQNAHGKTTLLRLVAGETQADQGQIRFPLLAQQGPRLDWPFIKQHIAFVPQELPSWGGSLKDTLHYEAAMHRIFGEDNRRAVDFIVERLGLGGHLKKSWSQLSGGYKVRFALARALVWKPRLLVMDEPLANLDVKAKEILLQDVRDLARSYSHPIAVIMSSHDLHNLELVCNQMVFLTDGKVKYIGPASSLGKTLHSRHFVIGSSLRIEEVRDRLEGTIVKEVREEGLNIRIITESNYNTIDVLRLLLLHNIDIQYFRDNSQSIRSLFD